MVRLRTSVAGFRLPAVPTPRRESPRQSSAAAAPVGIETVTKLAGSGSAAV